MSNVQYAHGCSEESIRIAVSKKGLISLLFCALATSDRGSLALRPVDRVLSLHRQYLRLKRSDKATVMLTRSKKFKRLPLRLSF
jgi:hypothetical protein